MYLSHIHTHTHTRMNKNKKQSTLTKFFIVFRYLFHILRLLLPIVVTDNRPTSSCHHNRKTTISLDRTKYGDLTIKKDFIIRPSLDKEKYSKVWNQFYARILWDKELVANTITTTNITTPEGLIHMSLGEETIFYLPIPPFDLSKDGCSKWLKWKEIETEDGEVPKRHHAEIEDHRP